MTIDDESARPEYADVSVDAAERLDALMARAPEGGFSSVQDTVWLAGDQLPDRYPLEATTPAATALLHPLVLRALEHLDDTPLTEDWRALALTATFNPELVRRLASGVAQSLRRQGVVGLLIPPVQVCADARGMEAGLTAANAGDETLTECFGSDPYLAGRIATALVRGAAGSGEHRGVALVLRAGSALLAEAGESSTETWRQRVFEPIAEMVRDGGLRALAITAADGTCARDLRAEFNSDSLILLRLGDLPEAFEEQLGPEGSVVPLGEAPTAHPALGEREAKRRARRLTALKLWLGLFDLPVVPVPEPEDETPLRERLALGATVVLNNQGTLPLAPGCRVVCYLSAALESGVQQEARDAFKRAPFPAQLEVSSWDPATGAALSADPESLDVDVIVWLVPAADIDAQSRARLLACGRPLVVVAMGAALLPGLESLVPAAALVQHFGNRELSARLLPGMLSGERLISGRLPHDRYAPTFPFGSGAWHRGVRYGPLSGPTAADSFSVIVLTQELVNDGRERVVEVPQLYLLPPETDAALVGKAALLGFARILIQPGEAIQVRFQLDTSLLAGIDADGEFVVEPGYVRLCVGPALGRVETELAIEITGEPRRLKQHQRVSTLVAVESVGRSNDE
ncbi:MAG: fibronectin type III-like domain-contianing protein [Pseudomonadota bacterium]